MCLGDIPFRMGPSVSERGLYDMISSIEYKPLLANFWEISETVLLENSSIKKSWVPIQFFKNRVVS